MQKAAIDYHIAEMGPAWGIFRDGMQMALRHDPADAIAFANYFADREALLGHGRVRVSADAVMHRTLRDLRLAA